MYARTRSPFNNPSASEDYCFVFDVSKVDLDQTLISVLVKPLKISFINELSPNLPSLAYGFPKRPVGVVGHRQ